MFLGQYHIRFTGHGRVILPRKFRQEISGEGRVILSRGLEGCIWGFSVNDFEKEAQKQLEISVTDEEGRNLRRYLFSAAESVDLDDQGRFIIPGILLIHAKLKDEVVIIGAGDHFEIWDPGKWQECLKQLINKK